MIFEVKYKYSMVFPAVYVIYHNNDCRHKTICTIATIIMSKILKVWII